MIFEFRCVEEWDFYLFIYFGCVLMCGEEVLGKLLRLFFSFFFLHLMIWAFLVADRTEKRRGRKRKQLGVPLLFLYMFFLFLVVA